MKIELTSETIKDDIQVLKLSFKNGKFTISNDFQEIELSRAMSTKIKAFVRDVNKITSGKIKQAEISTELSLKLIQ